MSDQLAVEHRAALDLIYPIADALQMKLFYNASEKGVQIKGVEKMSLPIDEAGESIPFEVKVHASTVGEMEAWALLRVRGALWVLVGYFRKIRELQLCIVDSSKGHFGPVAASAFNGLSMSDVAKKIGSGIVATYYREKDESAWRKLDVPDPVDAGQAGQAATWDWTATAARAITPQGD